MNFATMLPTIAHLPSALGFPASASNLVEIFRILLCMVAFVGCGSIAVAIADGRSDGLLFGKR